MNNITEMYRGQGRTVQAAGNHEEVLGNINLHVHVYPIIIFQYFTNLFRRKHMSENETVIEELRPLHAKGAIAEGTPRFTYEASVALVPLVRDN